MHKKQLAVAVVGGMLAAPGAFAQITISGQIKGKWLPLLSICLHARPKPTDRSAR